MALAHAIMTALIDDDLSGIELAKDFEASLGFFLARFAPANISGATQTCRQVLA